MSLGTLLLFGAANRARQNNPSPTGNPGGVGATSTGGGGGGNPGGSDAVILFPALGFPAMVDGTRTTHTLFCLLLAKSGFSESPGDIQTVLKYQSWPSPTAPIADPSTLNSFASGSVHSVGSKSIDDVLQAEGRIDLPGIGGQGRLLEEFLRAYKDKGYQKLVWCSINLPSTVQTSADRPGVYNLVIVNEDTVLREMIQAIPLPHENCPRGDDTRTPGGQSVRPLHPFCVFDRDYLNVAHLTDLHVACRWELMQQRIQSQHTGLTQYFNNLNTRLKKHLEEIGQGNDMHMAIMTGDLVDYNRGHDGTNNNDLNANYAFNRNWALLYEILTEHYQRPMFTVLGNHDWRLNPYAPVPQYLDQIFREPGTFSVVLLVILLMILLSGAGTGVFTGLGYSSFKKGGTGGTLGGIGFLLLALQWTPSVLALLLVIIEEWAGAAGTSLLDTWWLWLAMYGASLVVGGITAGALAGRDVEDDLGDGAAEGTLWGTVCGGGLFAILVIALVICRDKQMKEVPPYVFLTEPETEQVIPEDFHKTDLVGANGTLRTTELSFRWYSLAINPFVDYYFRFKDMSFVMLDWNRGESLLQGMPPLASLALSREQWRLVQRWSLGASSDKAVALLGMHATVFTPDKGVNMSTLQPKSSGMKWDDNKLDLSSFEWYRPELIELIKTMAGRVASAMSLSGHTHLSDVFQFKDQQNIIRRKRNAQDQVEKLESDKSYYIVTSCADPRGSRGGSDIEKRRPMRREIKFNATTGRVADISVKKPRLKPAPKLRPNV
jgi:hypothetical protein